MLKNSSKSKILMVSIAAAAMLFAGCSKKVEVTSDAGAKAASHSSAHSGASTHAVHQANASKPSATSVHFSFDSSSLDAAARATLDGYAAWLNASHGNKITIEGNCDQRGSREYNLALGQQRADSVRDYLTNRGVSANRIDTVSFGEERPACNGSGEACWAQNRRGDIVSR
ncbi:peptidoglycan-associated lipoprotein Pal [Mariprofundus ferrooxydans]|nr:peptidoglycan-associated lipoprotein Pal [Mariprofundus ferrooxydans]